MPRLTGGLIVGGGHRSISTEQRKRSRSDGGRAERGQGRRPQQWGQLRRNPQKAADIANHVKPLIKRGPKDRNLVWWVLEVSPELHQKLMERKRIYVGYSSCRVREFLEATKCFMCLKMSHSAKYCKTENVVCGWCAGHGHIGRDCPRKDGRLKCANCGRAASANHKGCTEVVMTRKRAIRRTDYGTDGRAKSTPK